MKSDFGFVIHPVDVNLVAPAFNDAKVFSKRKDLLEKIFEWLPSFKCSHITGVESKTGKTIEGDLVYVPYLPHQIMSLPSDVVFRRVVQAGQVAKDLGCKILGLGAYAAFVGHRGVLIEKELGMPVTTGSAYTVGSAIRAASWVAREVFGDRDMNIAVIGATGALGSAFARILAGKTKKNIILVARNLSRLKSLQEELSATHPLAQVRISDSIEQGIKDANLIFISTNTPDSIIDVNALLPGTVVCDLSQPHNIDETAASMRKDILVVDGGLIKPPGKEVKFNFYFGLPESLAFACMAETMILALEEHFESYSLGGKITAEKVDQILKWGDKHGFTLSDPLSFGKTITQEQIAQVQELVT